MTRQTKRNLIKFISLFITVAVALTFSFFSFGGMLNIPNLSHKIYWAITAFICSGVIEGTIYQIGIKSQLKKLTHQKSLKDRIFLTLLQEIYANKEKSEETVINKHILNKHPYDQTDLPEKLKTSLDEINQLKQKLEVLKKKKVPRLFKTGLKHLIQERKKEILKKETDFILESKKSDYEKNIVVHYTRDLASKRTSLHHSLWFINLLAGIGVCFATADSVKRTVLSVTQSLAPTVAHFGLHFAISGTVLSSVVWPLAIFGAVGYVLLIGYCINDMIENQVIAKCIQKFKDIWQHKENENKGRCYLRRTGLVIATAFSIALAAFGTLATAGTWWFAAKHGAQILAFFHRIANWVSPTTVGPIAATQMLYNTANGLKTSEQLVTQFSPSALFLQIKLSFKKTFKKEHISQFLNPFRLLSKTIELAFEGGLFIGHLIAIGLTTDVIKFKNYTVNPIIVALAGALGELFTDIPFLTSEPEAEKSGKPDVKQEEQANHPQIKANQDDSKIIKTENHGSDHHEHSSPVKTILKWILFYIPCSPLLIGSALWSYGFSQLADEAKGEKKLSLQNAFRAVFGFKHKKNKALKQLSLDNQDNKDIIKATIDLQKERYNSPVYGKTIARDKITKLNNLKNAVDESSAQNSAAFNQAIGAGEFANHRGCPFFKAAHSKNFADEVQKHVEAPQLQP